MFAGILELVVRRLTSTERLVDNNRLARDVVYHAVIAAERVSAVVPWDAEALHRYVRENIAYVEDVDPMNQRVRMPWITVDERAGDCKSTAIMIASLAKASGRCVVLRFLDQTGSGQWDHVFAVVDGIPVDPLERYGEQMPHYHAHDERL